MKYKIFKLILERIPSKIQNTSSSYQINLIIQDDSIKYHIYALFNVTKPRVMYLKKIICQRLQYLIKRFLMHFLYPQESNYQYQPTHDAQSQNFLMVLSIRPSKHQDFWLDEYFNDQVLQSYKKNEVSHVTPSQITQSSLPSHESQEALPNFTFKVNNISPFHNFQKHLLNLLRKVVKMKKSELSCFISGNRAMDLWKIFLSLRSNSKRNLYVIFGINHKENEQNLRLMAQSLPQLQRFLSMYSIKQIEEGQEALRTIVSRKISILGKSQLEHKCKMKKFEQFYSYLHQFAEELAEGVISRRITKERKQRIMKNQTTQE